MISVLLAACTPPDPIRPEPAAEPASTPTTVELDVEIPEPPCKPAAELVLNELSAAGTALVLDDFGEAVDWIELHNPGPDAVPLAGWTLSDDLDDPLEWAFPAKTLEPGAFLLLYASGKGLREPVVTWRTAVDQGDPWRYLPVTHEPDPDWFLPAFDDSSWDTGPSGFGRGDQDDATEVDARTVYVRTTFIVTDVERADLVDLRLHVDFDDGFVAYLNGLEVARADLGLSGLPPAWDQWAKHGNEPYLPTGEQPPMVDLRDALGVVTAGENTLAIEVHDYSESSTDLSLVPFLTLGFAAEHPSRSSAVLDLSRLDLHASFSLRAEGETVQLFDPAGCLADELSPGPMLADLSFGRQPDGVGALGYFLEPTPGAPNTTESRPGFASPPTFDPPPGRYPAGTEVTVRADAGAVVHVATGGWEPTEADAVPTEPLPTGPDAMVLRARAWQDGLWPSRIATGTWLGGEPGALAVVSVVSDPPNLWDEELGIYVLGPDYQPEPPYRGANFWEDWERAAHVEQWEPDGTLGFSVDAGLSIYGGTSRAHDQKSLLVRMRSGYGDSAIEHEVFPGLGIEVFDRLVLRAAGTDWLGCSWDGCGTGAHLRDPLMHRIAAGADLDVMAWRPAEVWLNGEYWGVYEIREKPDVDYVAAHHAAEDVDLLQLEGEALEGDGVHYHATLAWLREHDLADPVSYAHVRTLIDLDELANYLAFEVFYDNHDWPGNNIKYWRTRTPEGRWRWLLYDTDFGLGRWRGPDADSLGEALSPDGASWPNPAWSTELFRLLLGSPEFERDFVNRYADHLNTAFDPAVTRDVLREVEGALAPAMPRHLERWGRFDDGVTSYSLEDGAWEAEVAWIEEWLGERPAHAREHLIEHLGLAGTFTLALATDPPGAGTFRLAAVEVAAPFEGVYFQGIPVEVTAVPAAGYAFSGWSDPDLAPTATVTQDGEGRVELTARFD